MEIDIDLTNSDQRLDRYLRKRLKDHSLSEIFKLIRTKKVLVNGLKSKPEYRLKLGDTLTIFTETQTVEKEVFHGELPIIYEDEEILVVYKVKGLKTIPDKKGEVSLTGLVQTYLSELITPTFAPSPVSRLDRNTSGLVLFSKTYERLKSLNETMRQGGIKKYYLALLFGTMKNEELVRVKLLKDHEKNESVVSERGVPTETRFTPLASNERCSLVRVELITGKSHQIRAVSRYLGHPVLGDPKYGKGKGHQELEAYELEFESFHVRYIENRFRDLVRKEFSHDPLPGNTRTCRNISV
ncbi:pseudouridine synthase [Guggenheimella bovis]